MAKLTFNSVVYLKSTLEKVYVRAIITIGQKKIYKLSNGMKVGIDELTTELPVESLPELEVIQESTPEPEQIQPESTPDQHQSISEHPQSSPNQPQNKAAKKPTKKA